MMRLKQIAAVLCLLLTFSLLFLVSDKAFAQSDPEQDAAVGLTGTISSKPPTQAATISIPTNGQVFNSLPITVSGICKTGLLVEIYKNNVFGGAALCQNSTYSLKIDLFSGRNDLVARVYDSLNQPGPDSNTVTVTFDDSLPKSKSRVSLTTAYAKRGAAPGEELTWPITISGGTPPYALSIDWGDKSTSDLVSRDNAGDLTISHTYFQSGVYNLIVKATDKAGTIAFLQLVGIGNGPIQQTKSNINSNQPKTVTQASNKGLTITLSIAVPLVFLSFWLGKKHQLQTIRARLRRGLRPFD